MSGDFPEHWQLKSIEEAMDALIDYRGKTPKKTASGIPLITAKIVKNGRIHEPAEFISEDNYDSWMVRGLPKVGDVVVTTEAPLGEVAQINNSNIALAQRIVTLRGKKGLLNNDFLLYAMQSGFMQHQLESRASGSTVKGIKQSELRKVLVPIPPEKEQIEIAKHLKSIDSKLELNRQINQTLESMAQTIFKSWFVNFDPVKAKISALESGEDAEGVTRAAMRAISGKTDDELDKMEGGQPEYYAKLKTTAELFPEAMQDSELGEVPEDWGISSIGTEFDATMGQSPPGNTYNENGKGEPFFQGRRDFGWRYPKNRVYCTQPKRMAKKGDTLLSVRAPVGDINKAVSDCCIGRGIAALRHKSGCEAYTYYSMMDLSRNFKSFDSEGTVFGSINQKDLKALKIVKPSNNLVEMFTHNVGTLDQQILNFDYQIKVLSQLRDTLLPKLLSGEIPVDTTKNFSEEN